jgi:anti-sigma regulatory factor (Ser/Thr protein kinase)
MEHLDLPASAAAAGIGRAFISAYCDRHQLPGGTTEDAVLLTSELLSNAYLHARSPAVLTVRLFDGTLRVEISDDSEAPPAVRQPGPGTAGGRGVQLMDVLAQRWGVQPRHGGKAVWFELPARLSGSA